ncbi:MAG: DUF3800 domain-containing protein [Gemmatimonadales bacterium]|nr:DUF3800 domain-containing protein [Gemmatimonadales bacterium]
MNSEAFADESGNTGANYLDRAQRYLVHASFLVDEATLPQCNERVERELHHQRKIRRTHFAELKASRMMGSAAGRFRTFDLLIALQEAGAVPFIVAFDKHFGLGAKFVDLFLDPAVNDKVDGRYCTDTDAKRAAATTIGSLGEDTLQKIEDAVRGETLERNRLCVSRVEAELRSAGHTTLANEVRGALEHDDGPVWNTGGELAFPDPRKTVALNYPGFTLLIISVDAEARRRGASSLTLTHDHVGDMQPALLHAYDLVVDRQKYDRIFADPLLVPPGRVELMATPAFANSETCLMLQAADLLAGATAHWLRVAGRGESLDISTRNLASHGLMVLGSGTVPGTGLVFSDDAAWLGDVFRQLSPAQQAAIRGSMNA